MITVYAACITFIFALARVVIRYYRRYWHIPTLSGWIPFFMHPHLLTFDPEQLAERVTKLRSSWRNDPTFKNGIAKVWLGPFPFVLVTQPEIAYQVLNNSNSKSTLYKRIKFFLGDGLLTSQGDHYKYHRKIAARGFKLQNLHDAMVNAEKSAKIFCRDASNICYESENQNDNQLTHSLSRLLLEPFFKTIFTFDFNEIDQQSHKQIHRVVTCFTTLFLNCISKPGFDRVRYLSRIGREYNQLMRDVVNPLVDQIISKKMNQVTKCEPSSTLDFLTAEFVYSPEDFTLKDLRDEMKTFIVAGFETSFTSLRWILECLGCQQHAQDKICSELDEIFSDDNERPITMDDLRKMIYLEACIKESMRLYTPVWLIGRVIDKPFVAKALDGKEYLIEKGTDVGIMLGDMHLMENVHHDALSFNPERFLPGPVDDNRHSHSFIPFAAGNRVCIGNRYAMIQLKTIFATLFRHYTFKSLNSISQMKMLTAFTFYPSVSPKIKLIPRKDQS